MSEDPSHLTDREILILVHRDVRELSKSKEDHENRIRVVERLSAVAAGGVAVIGVVVGWLKLHVTPQ